MPAAAAKSLQSRPTLCDPIDGSPPGSPVPGILQARTLEWVVHAYSGVLFSLKNIIFFPLYFFLNAIYCSWQAILVSVDGSKEMFSYSEFI